MALNRQSRRSPVAMIAVVAAFLPAPNTVAQRKQGEVATAGDEVTVLVNRPSA